MAIPQNFAHFLEVRYAGFASGTIALREAGSKYQPIADRLIGLVAQMLIHEAAESAWRDFQAGSYLGRFTK